MNNFDIAQVYHVQSELITHIEEGLLTDVFGSSYGRGGDQHRLHFSQVDVATGADIFIRVIIPQLHKQAALSSPELKTLNATEDSETHLMFCYVQNEPSTLPGFK